MEKNFEIRTKISEPHDFNKNLIETLKNEKSGKLQNIKDCWENWPVTYIIYNKGKNGANKQAYVGETVNTIRRMHEHLKNEQKESLDFFVGIISKEFNQSVIKDLEAHLIPLMHADGYKMLNGNAGQNVNNYFNALEYRKSFRKVWEQLKRKKIVKGDYDELINSEMFKFSPYKTLDPKQYEVENKVIKQALTSLKNKEERSIVVEGGPGTGKSVLVIHLLKRLVDLQNGVVNEDDEIEDELKEQVNLMKKIIEEKGCLKIGIVTPIKQFRLTLENVVKKTPGLKKDNVISPYRLVYKDSEYKEKGVYKAIGENKYDILIVDETHRLCDEDKALNLYKNLFEKGLSEYDWIKECSRVQIFFYDREQQVSSKDDEKVKKEFEKIKKEKEYYHELKSQFRCLGGEDYIKHIEKILKGKEQKVIDFDGKYEFYLFEDVDKMRNEIIKKDNPKQNIRGRMIAGYAWEDKVLDKFDWNDRDIIKKEVWIDYENAVNEIGCIHTVQGQDINYAGVIIGNDLRYSKEKGIYIDYSNYKDKTEKDNFDENNDKDMKKLTEQIIKTYKVLLTRGINGTYVYACDKGLRDYLKTVMKTYNEKKQKTNNN